MEAKVGAQMESLEQEENEAHSKELSPDKPPLEGSLGSDEIYDDVPVCPRIGDQYQVEIPDLATEVERQQYVSSTLDNNSILGYDCSVGIGLAIPITWASHPPTEVKEMEKEFCEAKHCALEAESKDSSRDKESQVTQTDPTRSNISERGSFYQDNGKFGTSTSEECRDSSSKPMMQQSEAEGFALLPGLSASSWSDADTECFLLALYIFGKNLVLVNKFVENKNMGDILAYYYGRFYKTDAYKRWSDFKKIRSRKCILGQRIFTGWRQQELVSRLQSAIPKEAHDSLIEAFKTLNEGRASFEEFVFILKSTVGMLAFVAAVGIGKGKHDLTGVVPDPVRANQVVSVRSEIPAGKACSSLASEDIIKFLTGDFRLSKTRSNDLFWEAVWPRLLARGWHSEQPKDLSSICSKNSLVFLMPGIKKFSRKKHTRGTHYFDSVSDVLKKVASEPILLELEIDGMGTSVCADKNGWATDDKHDQSDFSNCQHQSYLHPKVPNGNQEIMKFTIIDTSLVQGEGPFKVRQLRSLPIDATVSYGLLVHSDKAKSSTSSEEADSDDRSSDDQDDSERGTTDANTLEKVGGCTTDKEIQSDALQTLAAVSSTLIPVNGHTSDEQLSDISNSKGNAKDITCYFGRSAKTGRHEYLSPVSKRRRLAICNNDRTSRCKLSFSKGEELNKEETQLVFGSSKPIEVGAGDACETKTSMNSSTKDSPDEKMNPAGGDPCSNVTVSQIKVAEETHIASSIDLNKPNTPPDDEMSTSIRITSLDHQVDVKAEEPPCVPDSKTLPGGPEVTGNPLESQPDQPSQMSSRRQSTRNRPPTTRALEAVALGFLGGAKRKSSDRKSPSSKTSTGRPSRRARKSDENSMPVPPSTDRGSSRIEMPKLMIGTRATQATFSCSDSVA